MRSEWKPKVLQRGATARYQRARRVRLRFIPRVEALSLARNRLLLYSRGVTPKTRERPEWRRPVRSSGRIGVLVGLLAIPVCSQETAAKPVFNLQEGMIPMRYGV